MKKYIAIVSAIGLFLAIYALTKGTKISASGSTTEQNVAVQNTVIGIGGVVILMISAVGLSVYKN